MLQQVQFTLSRRWQAPPWAPCLLAPSRTTTSMHNSQAVNFVQPGFHVWQSFLAEVIATAFLVTVVLQVSGLLPVNDVGRHVLGLLVPIAVGAAIMVAHLALIPIDGCSINPARSLGAVIAASGKAPSKAWSQIWVFLVGPFVGGVIPALVKTVVPTTLPPEEDREVEAPMAISPAPATISGFRAPRCLVVADARSVNSRLT